MHTSPVPASDETHAPKDSVRVWPSADGDRAAPPVALQQGAGLSPETRAALDAFSPGVAGTAETDVPFRARRDTRSKSPEPPRAARETSQSTHRFWLSRGRPSTSHIVILGLVAVVLVEPIAVVRYTRARSGYAPVAPITQPIPTPQAVVPTMPENQLVVNTPTRGAIVYVDGVRKGSSPLTLTGLPAGNHRVRVDAGGASAEEDVTIHEGNTNLLMTPVRSSPARAASGWVAMSAPIAVQVLERGKLIGSSADGPLPLSAGAHRLEIRSDEFGYRQEVQVIVPAGDIARVRPAVQDGVLQVNALPWASVWVDGKAVGDTPLGNLSVAIGPHQVRFRHPQLGEQVRSVVVSAKEAAHVSVDLRR